MKKKLIILSIIGIVLIGIIGGASFAYFTIANNIRNQNVVTSGTMFLLFTDGTNNPHLNPSSGWNNGVLTQTEDACT